MHELHTYPNKNNGLKLGGAKSNRSWGSVSPLSDLPTVILTGRQTRSVLEFIIMSQTLLVHRNTNKAPDVMVPTPCFQRFVLTAASRAKMFFLNVFAAKNRTENGSISSGT